ncbi:MAG: TRIC cation channel family protein, partial [Eggerthellaceae bacterium]|nr:TRIC cation channel family protein [Eggerthellaceae bacterium]
MLETVISIPFWLEFAAVMTGGLSGAMTAVRARYDVFGCCVIAIATGLGGGITRDILMQDYGIYAFQNPQLLVSCILGAILVFYFGKLATYLNPVVDLLDNISVALWAIIGAGKSMSAGLGIIPSII